MRSLLAVLVVGGAFAAAGPTALGDRNAQRDELRRNEALWRSQHLRDYRFRLRVRCFRPSAGHSVIVTVRDGRAHGASGYQKRLDTVPEIFRAIRDALDDPRAGDVSVSYDRRRGFPRSASIDRVKNAIDDEIGWTVDRFRPLCR